jgi:hypothetical protein
MWVVCKVFFVEQSTVQYSTACNTARYSRVKYIPEIIQHSTTQHSTTLSRTVQYILNSSPDTYQEG